jgi:regulatory protein
MWRKRSKTVEDSERIIKDVEKARERTMNRAVKLLTAKQRSVAELRERLLEKAWTNAEIVDRVLDKLKEYGYLDDQKYARELALSKLRQRPQGKRKLQQSMSQKKLDRDIRDEAIVAAFEKIPEVDLIDRAIEKRLRLKGRPETREDTKKFYDHLLRQGFDFDLIREKMSAVRKLESDE